jgi:hypothetical protein
MNWQVIAEWTSIGVLHQSNADASPQEIPPELKHER